MNLGKRALYALYTGHCDIACMRRKGMFTFTVSLQVHLEGAAGKNTRCSTVCIVMFILHFVLHIPLCLFNL